jgi:DNA polymerase
MTEPNQPPVAPRISALQRAWLREIGIERVWARQADDVPVARGKTAGSEALAARESGESAVPAQSVAPITPVAPSPANAPAASGRAGEPPVAAPIRAGSGAAGMARGAVSAAPKPAAGTSPAVVVENPALDTLDLDALSEQVTACTACGLCRGRKQAVFGTGARSARWMVVGEAPGEQEDRQGLPFVGRSGQLLDAMLASVGHSREQDVFIANVIKCRPPGNRNPKPEEIAACSPYLMRQIALLKPERILVLGRFAAQALLGTDATIGSLRGRVHTLKIDGREIPLVVSYHPAYLLRSPAEKARSWQDLRLAVDA